MLACVMPPVTDLAAPRFGWTRWPFRVLATLVAVLFYLQAVYAGQFLSGTLGGLTRHHDNAALTDMLLFVTLPAAALLRWPGRGPWWPLLAVVGLIALSYTQTYLGTERILTVHVPLGVAIILLSTGVAVWSWFYRSPARRREA